MYDYSRRLEDDFSSCFSVQWAIANNENVNVKSWRMKVLSPF